MSRKKQASLDVEKVDFDAALQTLGEIVQRMEAGDLSLEESLRYFEEGITLTRQCQEALKKAEQKIKILTMQQGEPALEPFNEDEE